MDRFHRLLGGSHLSDCSFCSGRAAAPSGEFRMTMFCTLGRVAETFFAGAMLGAIAAVGLTTYAFRKFR
jgi:hypothetical protein